MAAGDAADGLAALLAALEAGLHHPGRDCGRGGWLLHPDFHEVGRRSGARYDHDTVIGVLASGTPRPQVRAGGHRMQRPGPGWGAAALPPGAGGRGSVASHAPCATRSGPGWPTAAGSRQLSYHQGTPVDPDTLPLY